MTTVYLHVGMPKCASSALQSLMHRNDTIHRSEGLCYPRKFRETSGYFSHRPLHKLPAQDIGNAIAEISREASNAKCDKILISSEEFVNSLWDRDITGTIVRSLNEVFGIENVKVLMLFRNPFSFTESVFAQFIKGGMFRTHNENFLRSNSNDIMAFCQKFREINGFDFYNYGSFIERMRYHAPFNAFELMSTEREDWESMDILDVVCDMLGISRGTASVHSNERYSDKSLYLLHQARIKFGFERVRSRRSIVSAVFPSEGRTFSKLLHVHGKLFDRVLNSVHLDDRYFLRHSKYRSTSLFSVPDLYFHQKEMSDKLDVAEWEMKVVDRIIGADSISVSQARKIKKEISEIL